MTTETLDPIALIESLDPDHIRAELDKMYRREAALRVLLRAAEQRQRQIERAKRKEARRAD